MAVIKCKMCGGDLMIEEGMTVAECEYCGSRQTVPNVDNGRKLTLFARANRLRAACEFDKAAGVYESIVADFPEEPEAYWGLVLCRYGIEYVDDPATGRKVPTCHRSSFDSIMEDSDFEQACENADAVARRVYRDEARQIEELRKGILEVSGREEPYDAFICYKETDENGSRTLDSVLAQDIYDALTEKGYRVFFSRITLEDKLGQEYEPYIFAALNSAKVMLAVGTDYEYYNAVWVKNEWSRFLKLMEKDKSRHLIPCYKGIDAYDMPKEFARLQAQDLGKVGAIQDLLRGIEKLVPRKQSAAQTSDPVVVRQDGGPTLASLLKRGSIFLADREWSDADQYFNRVLDIDPENAEAYAGKLCAERMCPTIEDVAMDISSPTDLRDSGNYQRALRYADDQLRQTLQEIDKENRYRRVCAQMDTANTLADAQKLPRSFAEFSGYQDADERLREMENFIAQETKWTERREKYSRVAGCLMAAGRDYTIGLKSDGTVVAVGGNDAGQCNVADWEYITAVAGNQFHTVGLRADGVALASGKAHLGQCNVGDWTELVAVAAGSSYTVGLKRNGTLVTTGSNYYEQRRVDDWVNIVAVATGATHTVGLTGNGTVVAVGNNEYGQCGTGKWTDVAAVTAGELHTVGLKKDGTVVAVGAKGDGACDVSGWKNIVAVAAGTAHTVGLKNDGTVVAVGRNDNGQCDVGSWQGIIAIAAGFAHTVGLKQDGTVVAVGLNDKGQCDVGSWRLFDDADALVQMLEKKAALQAEKNESIRQEHADQVEQQQRERVHIFRNQEAERRKNEMRMEALQRELKEIEMEYQTLTIFNQKRRRELEERAVSIDYEIKRLRREMSK